MADKKSASPDVGASRLADDGTTVWGASVSNPDFTTSESNGQVEISKLLGYGPSEAITGRKLADVIGEDTRTVREMIEAERRRGTPILSDCANGYFLPVDEAEAERFVRSMRHRAHQILTTAAAVERAMGID